MSLDALVVSAESGVGTEDVERASLDGHSSVIEHNGGGISSGFTRKDRLRARRQGMSADMRVSRATLSSLGFRKHGARRVNSGFERLSGDSQDELARLIHKQAKARLRGIGSIYFIIKCS